MSSHPHSDFRVFINYRRDDTPGHAGRLYDALTAHFGDESVFIDIDKIDPGIDFKSAINQGISRCDALLAVIGPQWLTMKDSAGRRRLDNPDDYVRLEIEAALRRGVRVIPTLVEGAVMPTSTDLPPSMAELTARNSTQLGDGTRWRDDVRRLIAALDRIRQASAKGVGVGDAEVGSRDQATSRDVPAQLQQLERAILNQDPDLAPPAAARTADRPRPPAPATPIIGRRAELEAILQLLRDPTVRLLTLTGPGGTGKTRLALEVLQALDEEYPDGTAFVPLAPVRDPKLVVSTIAQTLGLRESGAEAIDVTLAQWLQDRRMLLVLDNFEQLVESGGQLLPILAAPGLQLLVTSRSSLRLTAEHELPVPPLQRADALALLVERARASRPDFDASREEPLLSEICDRLDDLPLAIELAAPRLKLMPPAAMLTRLEERLRFLTSGPRDLPTRQQTLRATLDWSYELLDEPEQRVFAQLSVFVGGCTLEAAEAVCDVDADVLDVVASLTDKSLVRMRYPDGGEPRLAMLQTVREYAQERLRELEAVEAVRDRHAEHYCELASAAAPELTRLDQVSWFERLEAEHDNLRTALSWLLERGRQEGALTLAGHLWRFWDAHGHMTEGAASLARALGDDPPPTLATADALNGAGCLAESLSRYDEAIEHHSRAGALYEELGDRSRLAWSYNNLGLLLTFRGELESAAEHLERSLEISREIDEGRLIAANLINLANVAYFERDYDRAEPLQEEGRRRSHELGNTRTEALACMNLGWIHIGQRDDERATLRLQESIEHFSRLHERRHLPDALEGLAAVAARSGEAERSAMLFGAAERIRQEIGSPLAATEARIYEEYWRLGRDRIGDEEYERVLAGGRGMSVDEAIAYAQTAAPAAATP